MFFSMEKESFTPRPNLLDVVEIDGRLAQVSPGTDRIIFLDDIVRLEGNLQLHHLHNINWDDYDFKEPDEENFTSYVLDLREKREISSEEYMAVYWGSEQEEHPYLRDCVTFFGRYELRNK